MPPEQNQPPNKRKITSYDQMSPQQKNALRNYRMYRDRLSDIEGQRRNDMNDQKLIGQEACSTM